MAAVEITLLLCGMAVAVLAGTSLAEPARLPAPLLLIVVGIAASYLPLVPEIHLSEVVLLGLLPPLLYAAALQTSLVDFNANRRPILLLSVGLVVFTTLGVGRGRAPAAARPRAGRPRSRSAPWSRRPTRSRRPRSAAGSGCPAGSSRSSRASRCSTTRPRWSRCAPRSRWPTVQGSTSRSTSASTSCVAAGGGVLVGFGFFLVVAWSAQARRPTR